ncbi:MAG: ATP synthase subunit I [Lachnospiraceae bacterium]|nr:ATP synthase subunit I [Lachnospiraceae bacterium]
MTGLLDRPDDTLVELWTGIIAYGVLCCLVGVWWVDSGVRYLLGVGIGILLALACAWHMWWSIDRNLEYNAGNEKAAGAYALKYSMIRYAFILCIFAMVCVTDVAYPLAAFLGIMGLKAGAYLQPFVNKIRSRIKNRDNNI